jgi:3-oxo-5-alpha-steroid 4-dehydrogenase 3
MEGEQQSEAMISRLIPCLCLLDTLITPVYAVLTLVALSSLAVPFLQDLASHGKTRDTSSTSASIQQQHRYRSSAAFFRSLVRRLSHGEEFLVPKKLFLHFYVCGLLSFVVLYLGAYFAAPTPMDRNPSLSHSTTLVLLLIHLSRRLYECLHVHEWTSHSKMHLAGYLVGILHYILLPFVFISMPCSHRNDDKEDTPVSSLYFRDSKSSSSQWVIITAASLFCLWAQYQQYRHHCLLARLRSPNIDNKITSKSKSNAKPAKTVYSLPVGGWFRFVTCPHYLAEILIYVAFAVLLEMEMQRQIQIHRDHSVHIRRFRYFFLLAWVATNLTVSALLNHKWYTKHIPNHTQLGRKAIIPLIL